ncbi:hypothetical protein BDW72DRAFT_166661 [Aspergillus terricola var. indicus]
MGGLFTGQGIRTFFQPHNIYEELGFPTENGVEGKTRTVSPFVYLKAIYELGHGLNLLALHHTRQYQAMTTLILMSAYMHLGFGIVVWKYGGPRRKVGAQGVFAAVFAFWYWQCWHSPGGVGGA